MQCLRRFTTYEMVETRELIVVKRDGRREPFSPDKLSNKLRIALTKRPVPTSEIDRIVRETESELIERGVREVPSTDIGEIVLAKLRDIDQVAYIRFASVYREFRDFDDWRREMAALDRARGNADTDGAHEQSATGEDRAHDAAPGHHDPQAR
jgi:transcriptional repressor NrdR